MKSIKVENLTAEFCKGWNGAKRSLDLMAEIENNPAARRILKVVKDAGDAIVRKMNN